MNYNPAAQVNSACKVVEADEPGGEVLGPDFPVRIPGSALIHAAALHHAFEIRCIETGIKPDVQIGNGSRSDLRLQFGGNVAEASTKQADKNFSATFSATFCPSTCPFTCLSTSLSASLSTSLTLRHHLFQHGSHFRLRQDQVRRQPTPDIARARASGCRVSHVIICACLPRLGMA